MEILAPAGNPEALKSAWAAGADAVYLGYSAFSARAGAGNFDAEELKEAIHFAHLHRMRVYVTVNILVKDRELPEVLALLGLLGELRTDGILIQDLGILRLARERFPELPLHASTQMAIHHAAGVRWCEKMGMKRVVLARECSLQEIRLCAKEGPEIEVFCHGAQCVAVSGLCLFSSMVGGRSGNRGRCAQPCRMVYDFRGKKGAWLSPRDVCLRDDLPALADAGAASLKIEGRLKRPEYVAVVTQSYRRAMDAAESGTFLPADETERRALLQIFNRGGFMRGYAFGCEDAGVIWQESVQHQGIEIGRVEAAAGGMARVRLTGALHNGDGLRIVGPDGSEEDMTYSGRVAEAGEIAPVRLRSGMRAGKGDRVLRLADTRQLEAAREMRGKPIPVQMCMEAWPGKPLTLQVTDGESTVTVTGERVEAAGNREATTEELTRSLAKTGGTAFAATAIRAETKGAFVPVSAVNALRRAALEELTEKRIAAFEKTSHAPSGTAEQAPPDSGGNGIPAPDKLPAVTVRTEEQAVLAREKGWMAAWYPEDFRDAAMEALSSWMQPGEWLRLPDVCEESTLEGLRDWVSRHREKLGGVVLGSVGQLGLAWEVPFGAGPGIPVMNREAIALLASEGCVFVTASPELTGEELSELLRDEPLPVMVNVYGRTQLMLLHHCPARTAMGMKKGHRDCRLCDTGDERALRGERLTDRKGYSFPLLRLRLEEGCLVRLMNALPTDLLDQRIPGIRAVELTEEDSGKTAEILTGLRLYQRTAGETTRGHWNRPTE